MAEQSAYTTVRGHRLFHVRDGEGGEDALRLIREQAPSTEAHAEPAVECA